MGIYPSGASPYGVQGLAGNVWEWTSTTYQPYPYQVNDGREDPNNQASKVLRGSSCTDAFWNARTTYRFYAYPTTTFNNWGSRLVRSIGAG